MTTAAPPILSERPAPSDLGAAAVRGARWIAVGRAGVEAASLAASVVLARLLSPADFGRAAVALVVCALALAVPSSGLGAPVVAAERVDRRLLGTAVLLSLLAGLGLTAATLACAPLLAGVLTEEIAGLIALAAPAFALWSLGTVPRALLQRRLDFRRLSLIELGAVVPGIATSVGCAAAGVGAASLVLGALAVAAATSLAANLAAPAPWPAWHASEARRLLAFGLPATGSTLLHVGARNVDYAILAARMGAAQVGLYWRAFQLGSDYQGKVSGILLRLALPVFARAGSREELRALRGRMVRLHTAVLFPLLGLLATVAPVLIPWFYGPAWSAAVLPTQILVVAGACAVVGTGTGPLMLALGRPRALLAANAVVLVVSAAVVVAAAPGGLVAVCLAVAGAQVVLLLGQQHVLVGRIAGIPLGASLRHDVLPAATGCVALLGVGSLTMALLESANAPTVLVLLITGVVASTAYAGLMRTVFTGTWADLRALGSQVRRRARTRSAGFTGN